MIVGDLDASTVRYRLQHEGLTVRTGPLSFRITTPLTDVAEVIHLLYSLHPVLPVEDGVDFRVRVSRPSGLRGLFRPQVIFKLDGEQPFLPLPGQQGFPLLEWGMNWCLHSQSPQFLVVHSAVLARGDQALILPAPSGSGKSTLCAGLAFKGWRLLSDELALIRPDTGRVQPLPRPISLKNRSISVIRDFVPDAVIGPAVADTLKGTVAHVRGPADSTALADRDARPRWLVFPRYEPGAPAELSVMPRHEAFMALMEQTFNFDGHGRQAFALLADLVDRSSCWRFRYGNLQEAIDLFDRTLVA